jgi:hypothetical protein
MLTKYCPGCNHHRPIAEFKGYNGRKLKRCQACRDQDRGYKAGRLAGTIAAVKTIECSVCHSRTIARTPQAPTLLGWREIDFNEGRGICYEH